MNTSDLANLLISTPDRTTIWNQVDDDEDDEPDEEVYGIISLIDLRQSEKTSCTESLRKLIMDNAGRDKKEKFEEAARSALSTKSALVLNERFINLPAHISLPCFESLVQDLKKKPDWDFDHFFMIIKVQKATEKKKSSKKSDAKRQKVDSEEAVADDAAGILFQNPEEEILCETAEHWTEFSVANQCDDDVRSGNWDEEDVKYRPFRRILLLDRQQFLAAISQLRHEFCGPAAS